MILDRIIEFVDSIDMSVVFRSRFRFLGVLISNSRPWTISQIVEVNFELPFWELFRASLLVVAYTLRYIIGALVVLLVICVASLIVYNSDSPWASWAGLLWNFLPPVLVGGWPTLILLAPIMTFVRSRAAFKRSGGGSQRCVFSEDGIRVESSIGNADLKWKAFSRVRESRKFFFLYSTPNYAVLIPKRAFADKSAEAQLRSLIRTHVPKFKLRDD